MSLDGLERLDVWRKAKNFAVFVYQNVVPVFPIEEKWNLAQQIRRAVQSIPANLAEGHGRFYYQENIHFSYIARGSLDETLSHVSLAHDLGYLPDPIFQEVVKQGDTLVRLINGYIAYLKRSRQGANEPGSADSIREPIADYDMESEIPLDEPLGS